jgi:hypothetical protein
LDFSQLPIHGLTRDCDSFTRDCFLADLDQRHTVNIYGRYRIRPSVNLGMKSGYGGAFPIPGYSKKRSPSIV